MRTLHIDRKNTRRRILEFIHTPLWLLGDICWLKGWDIAAYLFMVPTLALGLVICLYSSGKIKRLLFNTAQFLWLVGNALWMLSDFQNLELDNWVFGIFSVGLGLASWVFILLTRKYYAVGKNQN